MTFTPRPYQQETDDALQAFWTAGKLFPLIIAPTGAGKTEQAKMALQRFRSPMSVVHTRTLYEQTIRRMPFVRVYTLQGLLAKGPKADARRANLARHDVAWFDEAHHLGGEEWREILALPTLPKRRFGVTATPMRADGTPLGDIFDCFHVAAQYSQLVANGYLCKCDVVRSDISRTKQKKDKVRPDGVVAYLEHGKRPDGSWRPGIHFEVTIEACELAHQRYEQAGLRSFLITNKTDTDTRRKVFEAYGAGSYDMLVSPTVLAEGFDSPRAEVCVLRRSVDHVGDFLQRVGRVLRPFPGKERALLIDICNATQKHGLPTDDRVYSLEGKGIQSVEEAEAEKKALEEEAEAMAPKPWRVVESRYQLVRDTLLSRYKDICATADEYGYKQGWVFHRFAQVTSLALPPRMPGKYQSVCPVCRHRCKVGEEIFWVRGGLDNERKPDGTTLPIPVGTDPYTGQRNGAPLSGAMHPECWINALDAGAVELASAALEHEEGWRPRRQRASETAPAADDDIPF